MKKFLYVAGMVVVLSAILVVPAFAQPAPVTDLTSAGNNIIELLKLAFRVVIGLILLMMAWGVYLLFFQKGGEKKDEGRSFLIYGLISLAVLFSVWGLVGILQKTFGVNSNTQALPIPKVPTT